MGKSFEIRGSPVYGQGLEAAEASILKRRGLMCSCESNYEYVSSKGTENF